MLKPTVYLVRLKSFVNYKIGNYKALLSVNRIITHKEYRNQKNK